MSTPAAPALTPAERLAIRNAVDPIDSKSFLRRSEKLTLARDKINYIRVQVSDRDNVAPLVHASDREAFLALLKLASDALESAGNIIDFERDAIEREITRNEETLK